MSVGKIQMLDRLASTHCEHTRHHAFISTLSIEMFQMSSSKLIRSGLKTWSRLARSAGLTGNCFSRRLDSQHNDIRHNDTQHTQHYQYAECHCLFIVTLNVIMLSVVAPFFKGSSGIYLGKVFLRNHPWQHWYCICLGYLGCATKMGSFLFVRCRLKVPKACIVE